MNLELSAEISLIHGLSINNKGKFIWSSSFEALQKFVYSKSLILSGKDSQLFEGKLVDIASISETLVNVKDKINILPSPQTSSETNEIMISVTKRLAEVKCSSTKKVDPPETTLAILNNRLQNLTEELNSKMAAVNYTLSDHTKDLSELKNLNSESELSRLRKENAELKNENAMLKNKNEQITERVNNLNV
ncbi:Hypothetical predicted protein [Paramuricea clavata]|uniref:Uncharacterized protein n=1 Tax=Paramuricea clavata TaxID=317549 RepID=A0A7D9IZA7_PARCT|nr:Hypothetical predicted protein [Paramuricea clavata]